MSIKTEARVPRAMPRVSTTLLNVFALYSRQHVRRYFHSIRILKNKLPPPNVPGSIVIYLNHASWWDPLVCLFLARKFFADRISYAPIDAGSLRRYGFFKHLGFYGVEKESVFGAMTFLRTTCSLLRSQRSAVWLTPQGRFEDVRTRPVRLQPGIGSLARRMKNVAFVPLAIEYVFWTEPRPEILLSFGEPVIATGQALLNSGETTEFFGTVLEKEQDELATVSYRREPSDWIVLDRGASGVSRVYDTWRWLLSRIFGHEFIRGHNRGELI
jgi:1-acyl-sn-glycerol-3-phosphate acyltransferase